MASALLGGLPGAGATMRTATNVQAGGHTRISGMVHALVLLLTVFWDLITAVVVGVFLANILTIKRHSELQGQQVPHPESADGPGSLISPRVA